MWWSSGIGFPISLLALVAQVPLERERPSLSVPAMSAVKPDDFTFREGPDIFSPKDLVNLARPGTGSGNPAGDLLIVPVSKYSAEDKKCVSPSDSDRQSI